MTSPSARPPGLGKGFTLEACTVPSPEPLDEDFSLVGGLTPHRLRVTFIHCSAWHGVWGVGWGGGRSSDGGSDGDEEHLELEPHIWSRS